MMFGDLSESCQSWLADRGVRAVHFDGAYRFGFSRGYAKLTVEGTTIPIRIESHYLCSGVQAAGRLAWERKIQDPWELWSLFALTILSGLHTALHWYPSLASHTRDKFGGVDDDAVEGDEGEKDESHDDDGWVCEDGCDRDKSKHEKDEAETVGHVLRDMAHQLEELKTVGHVLRVVSRKLEQLEPVVVAARTTAQELTRLRELTEKALDPNTTENTGARYWRANR